MTFEITWNNQVGMEDFRHDLRSLPLVMTSFYECREVQPLVGLALDQKYVKPWTKNPSSRFPFCIFY